MWFLNWLAGYIVSWLLSLLAKKVASHAADIIQDKERGEVNEANTKKYEDAVTEEERIRAALDLLNRTKR